AIARAVVDDDHAPHPPGACDLVEHAGQRRLLVERRDDRVDDQRPSPVMVAVTRQTLPFIKKAPYAIRRHHIEDRMISPPDLRLLPEVAYASYQAYLAAVGSSAVEKARAQAPEVVLAEVRASGLRGRGGAGFPTGTKWLSVKRNTCPIRYVVVNAAEGEPGTFKDRWLLRKNPYAMLEGLLIAAHVIGARVAYIATKAS